MSRLPRQVEVLYHAKDQTREDVNDRKQPAYMGWAEDFVFAGLSAFLLFIAAFFKTHWYLCFIALMPFIYRAGRASVLSSLWLGLLFGISFFVTSGIDSGIAAGAAVSLRIASGIALFALFAGGLAWVRRRLGFNLILFALLWAAFELVLIKLGFIHGLFGDLKFSVPFFAVLGTVFGFVIVSFVIVLTNLLLALAIEKAIAAVKKARVIVYSDGEIWGWRLANKLRIENLYLIPEGRGPPIA
ncbi:MAG: hypothetical protein JSU69_02390 [Candidatus Zixiibacteriota bacterium]|nr:MAG: hypothetical protein JSU69_02390 [candidate division Zixibacteria bacterium]